ncbi:3,4-dihydroxy-2-butanone-4-phosphate synthase [Pseudomonas rhodesiae]|uniref:3,4-dihydroxy-2-butanone-4-phosphate synthase n=1 Tax=Pseudomonas rhodesiae TaxID=76760 RepID=UPI001BCD91A0|nr:3,4-dihydroxy-2-butanone-4-phosphate synthase [Pseudomonas rhodesiae]QVN04050.1 3,4-dihydroxy-2-butanone-4-phosphate synthase [Pseudomonas rhodesiae]
MKLDSVASAINAISQGEMVIVVDDEDRENEGDLVVAAELVTPETIAFMMRLGRGLICVSIQPELATQLNLPLMVSENSESFATAFTVSIDGVKDVTTGISASDRSNTIRQMLVPSARPQDFRRPGHVFPLIAHPQGVLGRNGHTEASVELARLAGLTPSGVICEIANDDGSMSRLPELMNFAKKHALRIVSIRDLIEYVSHELMPYVGISKMRRAV